VSIWVHKVKKRLKEYRRVQLQRDEDRGGRELYMGRGRGGAEGERGGTVLATYTPSKWRKYCTVHQRYSAVYTNRYR
jgi:hypothetical protein